LGFPSARLSFALLAAWCLAVAFYMAAVIFNSNRVLPEKILKHGFRFEFADIKSAAEDLIQNKNDD
jgi:NAD dependent epimerase/dehydratase family enzyme